MSGVIMNDALKVTRTARTSSDRTVSFNSRSPITVTCRPLDDVSARSHIIYASSRILPSHLTFSDLVFENSQVVIREIKTCHSNSIAESALIVLLILNNIALAMTVHHLTLCHLFNILRNIF